MASFFYFLTSVPVSSFCVGFMSNQGYLQVRGTLFHLSSIFSWGIALGEIQQWCTDRMKWLVLRQENQISSWNISPIAACCFYDYCWFRKRKDTSVTLQSVCLFSHVCVFKMSSKMAYSLLFRTTSCWFTHFRTYTSTSLLVYTTQKTRTFIVEFQGFSRLLKFGQVH